MHAPWGARFAAIRCVEGPGCPLFVSGVASEATLPKWRTAKVVVEPDATTSKDWASQRPKEVLPVRQHPWVAQLRPPKKGPSQ